MLVKDSIWFAGTHSRSWRKGSFHPVQYLRRLKHVTPLKLFYLFFRMLLNMFRHAPAQDAPQACRNIPYLKRMICLPAPISIIPDLSHTIFLSTGAIPSGTTTEAVAPDGTVTAYDRPSTDFSHRTAAVPKGVSFVTSAHSTPEGICGFTVKRP